MDIEELEMICADLGIDPESVSSDIDFSLFHAKDVVKKIEEFVASTLSSQGVKQVAVEF